MVSFPSTHSSAGASARLLHSTAEPSARDGAVPQDAQFLAECSIKGVMGCKLMSALSGDYGAEKRGACIAYRNRNGKLVEQCGSLPATHP